VRGIEITVEREITTVIIRRKDESSGPTLPTKPPADEDSDNSLLATPKPFISIDLIGS
jgi:hypothetical protein